MARGKGTHRTSTRAHTNTKATTAARLARLADDRPYWYRQPTEPETAYAAFLRLRSYPIPRPSVPVLREVLGSTHKLSTMEQWASRYCWYERLQAWDAHIAKPLDDAIVAQYVGSVQAVATPAQEHAKSLHTLARQEIEKLIQLSADNPAPVVTPKILMQLIQMGLQIDHVITGGEAQEIGAEGPDLSNLETEDLLRLQKIAWKALAPGESKR